MPQYNRNDLEIAARNQHFTRDTFEKVLRLKTILDWMNVHEFLRAHLLLKGGTAINLTVFELPRLSVDIDMDFVPNLPREDMLQARETISGTIKAYMESEGYAFSPASRIHHSLDALHFTYTNAAGNQDMIKIELNYSLRAHLFEPMEKLLQQMPSVLVQRSLLSTLWRFLQQRQMRFYLAQLQGICMISIR